MCGISLYISKHNAVFQVLESLYELQNRGYDSFGIAYFDASLNSFSTHKRSLACVFNENHNINLYSEFKKETKDLFSHICMGHSRWATHGKVNYNNTHPHMSNHEDFYLIHNGIIENYNELKEILIEEGYTFYSNTDSEVIVNFIEYYYTKNGFNVKEAIVNTIRVLEGTYGLVILHKDTPEMAYVIKQGSPLLISKTENEIIATSELCGFLKNTSQYYELANNELVVLSLENGIEFDHKRQSICKEISPEFQECYLTQNLKNFSHYTQKEILEQDDTLSLSLNNGGRVCNGKIYLGGMNYLLPILPNIQNIVFMGCGSSYIAGTIGMRYIKQIQSLRHIHVYCYDGGDFEDIDVPDGLCLFIFISQSGETMDLIRHLNYIQKDHHTMGIVNVIDSTIAKEVDGGIYMNVGKEVAVASTKSFNSSLLILKLFALWLYQEQCGRFMGIEILKMMNYVKEQTININNMIYQVKKLNDEMNILLEKQNLDVFLQEHVFILGKGTMESIARECALKLKEICYIHGEGLSASSLKHGPLAMIHHHFPVILLINHEYGDKMMNAFYELRSRNAHVLVITSEHDIMKKIKAEECDAIYIPKNKGCSEILFMLTLQHLCYTLALRKKIDPDKPKNLAKVVTVE